jgi:hypothetical protein
MIQPDAFIPRDMLVFVPSGVHLVSVDPYLRLALAEFVDVGISEHTEIRVRCLTNPGGFPRTTNRT